MVTPLNSPGSMSSLHDTVASSGGNDVWGTSHDNQEEGLTSRA